MSRKEHRGGFRAAFRHAFAIPDEGDLSDEEREWLERLANGIARRRLSAPATFLLETARPLNYLGAHVIMFFKPIISVVFPARDCERVARLLEKRGALPALVEMLENRRGKPNEGADPHNP